MLKYMLKSIHLHKLEKENRGKRLEDDKFKNGNYIMV